MYIYSAPYHVTNNKIAFVVGTRLKIIYILFHHNFQYTAGSAGGSRPIMPISQALFHEHIIFFNYSLTHSDSLEKIINNQKIIAKLVLSHFLCHISTKF